MHGVRSSCWAGAMRGRAANLLGLAAVLALVSCQGAADAALSEGHAQVAAADDSTQQGEPLQVHAQNPKAQGTCWVFGLHVRGAHFGSAGRAVQGVGDRAVLAPWRNTQGFINADSVPRSGIVNVEPRC